MYEGGLRSSWTGGSAPLLCRGRQRTFQTALVHNIDKTDVIDTFHYFSHSTGTFGSLFRFSQREYNIFIRVT
jgi:hypothetical protein